jgi:copper homeostasis protein
MHKHLILEACTESLVEAILAEKRGADRIELCTRLDLDGLTPGIELIQQVLENVNIPVKVMIRPRAGNFIYSEDEINQMIESIQYCKTLKIQGVVFGITDEENHLATETIEKLARLANPMEVTIHKAIDTCNNPVFEISQLLKIKSITSVLTSGKAKTALDGSDTIKEMIKIAGDQIKIIAAGKITKSNLSYIHKIIRANEYHGRKIV